MTRRAVFFLMLAIASMRLAAEQPADAIKAYCIDFNWGEGGPNGFAPPGMWADADPAQHVAWYKAVGANVIQTFCVSCNGYAWYKNGLVPPQPGLRHDFLTETVRLGHKEGLRVMGYFCAGSNTRWGKEHPDLSYGIPSSPHIPYTDEYLSYLSAAIGDAVRKTGIDGFMVDWLWQPDRASTGGKWLDCEKKLYTELMGQAFPADGKLTEEQDVAYSRAAIARCWDAIHKAAKEANPNCIIWLSNNNPTHPHVVNSKMYKEVDWLMNEAGDLERVKALQPMIGAHTRLITCLANWNGQDPAAIVPAALKENIGLYGFTKPQADSLVPLEPCLAEPVRNLKGDARNIAVLARAYHGVSLEAVEKNGVWTTSQLWEIAQDHAATHRFSTLFTADDVRDRLSSEAGLDQAIAWCRKTGVTKVYIEEFRGFQADRGAILRAKQRFQDAGFLVSGCVTTVNIGKPSTGWKENISCYTDMPTQEKLQRIFEFAGGLFDEVMIDDFWFTDCQCPACDAARQARAVTIGQKTYPAAGDSWEDDRCALMLHLSQDRLLDAAKKVNPNTHLIIKYPEWYDALQDRGYDVAGETAIFDRIWVGTETRDYTNKQWGGKAPFAGYFIMRWLGGIGGAKCGGGWYDWLGTTPHTYLEQARQTILGGARESMLFCYGGLQSDTGPADVEALRASLPELLETAEQVSRRQPLGIAAYKPANSHPQGEEKVFDFVGMLGLPLVPCHQFPTNAPAAFFSAHALKDAALASELAAFIKTGKPVLLTDGLAEQLKDVDIAATNVHILSVKQKPKSLLELSQNELDDLRAPLLKPLGVQFKAPNGVALYLFAPGGWVIENFNDQPAHVLFNDQSYTIEPRGWKQQWF